MKKMLLPTLLILCFEAGHCQEVKIRNLVFEGAGIRGLAYAGVMDEFENLGLVQDIEKAGGISAGAITAMMVSLGYTADAQFLRCYI